MQVFVTYSEGEYFTQLSEDEFARQQEVGVKFAAVRVGDWIYDYVLKNLGRSPIRSIKWYAIND